MINSMSELAEPVIGRYAPPLDKSRIPEGNATPEIFERSNIVVHHTFGKEPVIDAVGDGEVADQFVDVGKEEQEIEPLVPDETKQRIYALAENIVANPDDHEDFISEARGLFPDPTDRQYFAIQLARRRVNNSGAGTGEHFPRQELSDEYKKLKLQMLKEKRNKAS